MRAIGIGEAIERDAPLRTSEQIGDAGHFSDEDFIPAVEELRIRDIDGERGSQARRLAK